MSGQDKNISFDDHVETYQEDIQNAIDFSGQNVDFFIEVKANLIIEIAKKYFSDYKNINLLNVGCGIGLTDNYLKKEFKCLRGVDIEEATVNKAKLNNPGVDYMLYDAKTLPFDNDFFDFVFTINVMHHVPPSHWNDFVKEIHRVCKSGGIVAVFEHNPANLLTRKVVRDCVFDRDVVLLRNKTIRKLFLQNNLSLLESKYILFFPFRKNLFRMIEKMLGWFPLGAQQYVVSKKNL